MKARDRLSQGTPPTTSYVYHKRQTDSGLFRHSTLQCPTVAGNVQPAELSELHFCRFNFVFGSS